MRHLIGLLAVLSLLSVSGVAFAQTARRPNVLFILTDDQRADCLSLAGTRLSRLRTSIAWVRKGCISNGSSAPPFCARPAGDRS